MPEANTAEKQPEEQVDNDSENESRAFLGLSQAQRFRIYGWGALVLILGAAIWTLSYLDFFRWYSYKDQSGLNKAAKDVEVGHVLWEDAKPAEGVAKKNTILQSTISSNGARMIFARGDSDGNSDLFLLLSDGNNWSQERPMRALNSKFNETSPDLSGDGKYLFFTSDRPGGQGGYDIWVSKWDGVEYAWPLPLTEKVNTPFDEIDPAIDPESLKLYFASNRPHQAVGISEKEAAAAAEAEQLADVSGQEVDYDLYSADIAGNTPYELISARQLSMLYSLREGALADTGVMAKLGGTPLSEAAVDKALAYLVSQQEEDGRWDITRTGGTRGHDVAATAFSLLALYGRGERHDAPCKYQDNVKRGLDWLTGQQNGASGDLRGNSPLGNAMYDHGIAALALVEAYGVTKDQELKGKAFAAIDFIVDSQHEEGGWRYQPRQRGDLSVSGWMVMALASAEMSGIKIPNKKKTWQGIRDFLKIVGGGKDGGSYGYTDSPGGKNSGKNAMNAVGFFCAQLTRSSSNAAKAFESSLILDKAGFSLADIYYAYYGTLAVYQHQGPVWRKWIKRMQEEFLKAQAQDGSWQLNGPHTGPMGKVIMTALVTLCLEAHYRYTPLYGLGFEPDPSGPSSNVIEGDALPKDTHFRQAKHLAVLSANKVDDKAPVITEHGDFLYFASSREGGEGGSDIYRARVSGKSPKAPVNLGKEINSTGDEIDPAVRMAGFHLLFNSNRGGNTFNLYGAKSKRVVKKYDYTKMPSGAWFVRNIGWLIALMVALVLFIYLARRAMRQPRGPADAATEDSLLPPEQENPTETAS
ncbi:MAG: hypothetical protein VCA55_08920 [Verrucomicrobiales bacterium]